MHFLDLTLPSAAENLSLDEALLEEAERGNLGEMLRIWESPELAVVLGRSSRLAEEANVALCAADHVPVLRRASGGCAVVIGPGCLMYSVVLSYARHPQLQQIDEAHRHVLTRVQAALASQLPTTAFAGTSDLAWQDRKFSGNSLRCKRGNLLYHGTILYDFPLDRIARYLRKPPREPEYRAGRDHAAFVGNVRVNRHELISELAKCFAAYEPLTQWPKQRTQYWMQQRYGREAWHQER